MQIKNTCFSFNALSFYQLIVQKTILSSLYENKIDFVWYVLKKSTSESNSSNNNENTVLVKFAYYFIL